MENVSILINQLICMALYMLIGLALYKAKLVTLQNNKALSSVIIYAIMPCVIINSFAVQGSVEKNKELLWSFLLAGISFGISILISNLIFHKDPIANFSSIFSNAGFMSIPLITAVLGSEAVFYIAGLLAFFNMLQCTYGQAMLSGSYKDCNFKALIKHPIIIAFIVALPIYFLQITLPYHIATVAKAVAACNGPMAMIATGVFLGQMDFKAVKDKSIWIVSAVRLILISLITLAVFGLFKDVNLNIRTAIMISSVAPVGSNVTIYADRTGNDTKRATAMVCLSTVLSLFTMPLMMLLASKFWA